MIFLAKGNFKETHNCTPYAKWGVEALKPYWVEYKTSILVHGLYNHQGLNSFLQLHQAEDGVLFYSILDEGPVVAQVEKKNILKN